MITKGQLRLLTITQRDTGVQFKVKKFSNNETTIVLESTNAKQYRTVALNMIKFLSALNNDNGAWSAEKK